MCVLFTALSCFILSKYLWINLQLIFFKLGITFLFYYVLCLESKTKTRRKCWLLCDELGNSLNEISSFFFFSFIPLQRGWCFLCREVHLFYFSISFLAQIVSCYSINSSHNFFYFFLYLFSLCMAFYAQLTLEQMEG